MADLEALTDRQREILEGAVKAWQADGPGTAHQPLIYEGDQGKHENWPNDIAPPGRRESNDLVRAKWLVSDPSVAPAWSLSPSAAALEAFGGQADLIAGLSDADRRLGLILEGVVAAYRADPATPLHIAIMDQTTRVIGTGWPLPPDAAGRHDFELLEDEGLVRIHERGEHDIAVTPTPFGRGVVLRPQETLQQLSEDTEDPERRGRLRRALAAIKASDIATNAAGGSISGAALLAITGG